MISFKDLKVGVKLGLGFGALLALAAALGVLAVVNMKVVQTGGEKLANAHVPEVRVASEVQRDSLRTMFSMRGYFFSKDKKYWDEGLKHLAEVRKDLADAKELYTAQAFLTKLKENAAAAQAGVDEYEREAKTSNEAVEALLRERQAMDGLAAEFVKNASDFLEDQNETMTRELAAGLSAEKIEERHVKLAMVTRIVALGSDCRIKNFKSQSTGDVDIAKAALPNFEQIDQLCDKLKAVTRQEENLRQIAAIRSSADGYGAAMKRIVDLGIKLRDLDTARNKAAEAVLEAAGVTAQAGMEQAQKIAAEAAESLSTASRVVIGGLVVAVVLGFVVAIVLTRLITGPLRKGVFFATKVAEGDLNQKLDVVQKDEVGVLAEAMRKMVAELKQKLGFAQGVLDGFVLPCSVFDTDNKATFINAHMMAALDREGDPQAHYGEVSGQFVYGDPGRETLTLKALREKRRLDAEVEYTTAKGNAKIFDVTSTPINDLDGNLLGVLATWFELTDIRAQQKKIEAQNQKIAAAAAAANTVSDQVASASE
ncbi:MAG TPA: hypothetical protein DDW80_05475, partial [Desulfovibrio sp.]|nr:hypothetical protein [Desulfovibrio sp.]